MSTEIIGDASDSDKRHKYTVWKSEVFLNAPGGTVDSNCSDQSLYTLRAV